MARRARHSLMMATGEGTRRELRGVWRLCLAVLLCGPGLTLVAGEWDAVPVRPTVPVTPVSHGTSRLQSRSWDTLSEIWSSPTLTGNWGRRRQAIRDSGITFVGNETQFLYGVAGGLRGPGLGPLQPGDTTSYTGRGQYELIFDLEQFGGLPKGRLLIGAQRWYGDYGNVSLNTGSYAPAVFPALLPTTPDDPNTPYITDFLLTQPLSENLVVFGGKKNVVGVADQDVFAGGNGTHQFVNQALIVNPAFLMGLPYTSFTAGVASPQEWGQVSAFIMDPQNRVKDFFRVDDLFSTGVIIGTEIKVNTKFADKPGSQYVGAIWKHDSQLDLRGAAGLPGLYPDYSTTGLPTVSDSWTLYYGFDHYLFQNPADPKKGWGLFGRAALTDGNPNPVHYFLSVGLGGDSTLRAGKGDRWGIGWYYVGASPNFGPVPQALLGPQDGTGVETFYNFAVNQWLNVSPGFQYIHPGAGALADDAFVYGVRVNMRL